jgi:PAS domain S-box-containing protein
VDGRVCGAIVTFVDNSKQRKAEEDLKESQKRFQGLVENLYDWIWETDIEGHYTYVSPQVQHILGYEPSEILGKTPFDFMPPDDGTDFDTLIKAADEAMYRVKNNGKSSYAFASPGEIRTSAN